MQENSQAHSFDIVMEVNKINDNNVTTNPTNMSTAWNQL